MQLLPYAQRLILRLPGGGVLTRVFIGSVVLAAGVSLMAAPDRPSQSDLDAFMEKVLATRDENWKKLQQYVLDERERVELRGPANVGIWGQVREYSWFIREGYFVRSPTKAGGVTVPEDDRRKYEDEFLRRAKVRDERAKKNQAADPDAPPEPPAAGVPSGSMDALLTQTRQPGFMDSAYFLRFKFESGKYVFAGRETFEGREVLRIEYYPSKLFSHEQEAEQKRRETGKKSRDEDVEATMERLMNKVSLVTLWIEPASHQIVKYTFDNVHMDFLPAAWLFRMEDLKASMTMSQPFKEVWLPRDVDFFFSGFMALGSVTARFHLEYYDYREAKTSGRIKGLEQLR